jgi:hypothetical protein
LRDAPAPRYLAAMGKSDDERARRLAEALRKNLGRRKAQARDRAAPAPPPAANDDDYGDGGAPPAA